MTRLFTATTTAGKVDGKIAIIVHNTPVLVWDEYEITLSTGGYRSRLTKNKINDASLKFELGFRLYQKNHKWYVVRKEPRDCVSQVIGSSYDWDNPIEWVDPEEKPFIIERR